MPCHVTLCPNAPRHCRGEMRGMARYEKGDVMNRKRVMIVTAVALAGALALTCVFALGFQSRVRRMFSLNQQRIAQGYYMGDFEFKMVGALYDLDHGRYLTAIRRLNRYYEQLETGRGLIKVPDFKNAAQELEFYKNLQDERTGAFMDPSYPLCTYFQPTLNVIQHIERLSTNLGRPVTLKYPLKFLERLDSPEELEAYLDDLSTVGVLVGKMPKTPNVLASLKAYDDLERLRLHFFSNEWKRALLRWHWERQDPQSGYWDVRRRSDGRPLKGGDLTNTGRIIKMFVDENGEDLHPQFPLRYRKQMLATTLEKLKTPLPPDLPGQHEWAIDRSRCVRLLTEYLWRTMTNDQKQQAEVELERLVRVVFTRFYIPKQGAFSLYAGQESATLDGTAEFLSIMTRLGFFSTQQQKKLWGETLMEEEQSAESGSWSPEAVKNRNEIQRMNSIRIYGPDFDPDDLTKGVLVVAYPGPAATPDAVDLAQNIARWVDAAPQRMGNWVSRETLRRRAPRLAVPEVFIVRADEDGAALDRFLREREWRMIIGFDELQRPRMRLAKT